MYRIIVQRVPNLKFTQKLPLQKSVTYGRFSRRHKSSKPDVCPPSGPRPVPTGLIYTVGTITIITGGTVAYASYDSNFRSWLADTVPYSDQFIKFVLQEEKSYVESFFALLDHIKESSASLLDDIMGSKKPIKEVPKDYTPPAPAFKALASEKEEEKYAEIRLEKKDPETSETNVTISGDPKITNKEYDDTHPKSIVVLEEKLAHSASDTVQLFNKAVFALQRYNQDIEKVVESSVDRLDKSAWNSLRETTKQKNEVIENAEKSLKETTEYVNELRGLMKDPQLNVPEVVKKQTQFNLNKVEEDISKARKELERAQASANITNKYWKKVEEARNHFIDEIEILFPTVDIKSKKLQLQGGELDMFILHAFSNVLYYQKELYKIQILEEQKMKNAMESARRGNPEVLTETQVQCLVEKERLNLEEDFKKRCLCLRVEKETELRNQLKLQSEAFNDHLQEALRTKQMELERNFAREMDEKVTEERCKFKLQLSALAGRVKGIDDALKARMEADKNAKKSQMMWSACQALFRALRAGCPGMPWREQLRPLEAEIIAVKQAAAEKDEMVQAVLAGIPNEAAERGVYPEDALRERFINVEKAARQLALVPAEGARLHMYILSYLQSVLLLQSVNPISQAELNDEEVDFSQLSTIDILQRARYWVDRGNFTQTLRYMNLLKGASRSAANQWMRETRILLETQQAANTLMAHAAATGLQYL